jgi:hypothetical protein
MPQAEKKLTQLQCQIDPDGDGLRTVRLIVVPEMMDHDWRVGQPLGS